MNEILKQQRNEITEYYTYKKLASMSSDLHNKKILNKIASEELVHYNFWKKITKRDVEPNKFRIMKYTFLSRFFGLSFGLKLMERGEESSQEFYRRISKEYPEALQIEKSEKEHEMKLIGILNDSKLKYASSIVLGLNDALIELTGTLAGLTLALRDTKIIAITGMIMGLAASMSMAASGYLSTREDNEEGKDAITSAIYTGFAYVITVIFLVLPYFLFSNVFISLGVMLGVALIIILVYNYYISVSRGVSLFKRFSEMAILSMGVAGISFGFGYLVKILFGI